MRWQQRSEFFSRSNERVPLNTNSLIRSLNRVTVRSSYRTPPSLLWSPTVQHPTLLFFSKSPFSLEKYYFWKVHAQVFFCPGEQFLVRLAKINCLVCRCQSPSFSNMLPKLLCLRVTRVDKICQSVPAAQVLFEKPGISAPFLKKSCAKCMKKCQIRSHKAQN